MSIRGTLIKSGLSLHHRLHRPKSSTAARQEAALRHLLYKARKTAFGEHYHFRQLLKEADVVDAFRKRVPLFDYDTLYDTWWKRMLAGEPNVCWPGLVEYFALSSGTSGGPTKYIPISQEMIRSMRRTNTRIFAGSTQLGLNADFYDTEMMAIGSTIELREHGPVYVGDISGINARHIPNWFAVRFYKPGKSVATLSDWDARLARIIDMAPSCNIGTLCGIPSWVQMVLEGIIKHYKLQNIHEIWPNLQVYVSGGVAFGPYKEKFDSFMGRGIIYLDTYYTSEGCLAGQTRLSEEGLMPMELILNNGIYFEFIPFNEENFEAGQVRADAKVLSIDEVNTKEEYALVLSTCSGTWRYLIGDTIRFIDTERAEIVITGRTKHFLSITGEHLSVDNMNQALTTLSKKYGIHIPEFTVKAMRKGDIFAHHWYLGCDSLPACSEDEFMQELDALLCQGNADYETERTLNLLKEVKLRFLPTQIFYDWQASLGRMGGQSKFPRVLNDSRFQTWIHFLSNAGYTVLPLD